jgi:hypothetical protein
MERLLKIGNQIVRVFQSNREPKQVFHQAHVCAVSRTRRLVLDQTLDVSETGARQLNQALFCRPSP